MTDNEVVGPSDVLHQLLLEKISLQSQPLPMTNDGSKNSTRDDVSLS